MKTYHIIARIVFLMLLPLAVSQAAPLGGSTNYFNEAAFLYTDQKTDEALELTKQGLALYPDDLPLIKLKELLEQQQEQEQDQQQQQQQEQQEQEQQEQQQDQEQQEQQQDQEQQEQQEDQQDEENDQQQEQEQNQPQQEPPEERRAEEMTPEEAEMLLDAMRDEEQARRDAMRMIMGVP